MQACFFVLAQAVDNPVRKLLAACGQLVGRLRHASHEPS